MPSESAFCLNDPSLRFSDGTFVVWQSISPIKASVWSRYLPESAKRVADWTFPWVCGGCTEPTFKDW
jgi:urea transport system substrate-binding protein